MTPNPKDRPRLGRGLSSLISVPAQPPALPAESAGGQTGQSASSPSSATAPTGQPVDLPLAAIRPNPHQPRRTFDDRSLAELAASMKATGVIQPIIVRQVAEGYELIAGERRLRAAKLAGLSAVPAIVRDVDAIAQAQMALIENIQREDLNPIERAEGYRTLLSQLGLTQTELATRLGEDRSTIANFLRLLELADPVRQMVANGQLSVGHAKVLAGVQAPAEQERLAKLVVSQDLSVRNLERLVASGAPAAAKPAAAPSPHLQDLEKNLARQLGMRVQLRTNPKAKGKGRLVIHYANLDQFDQLLSRLGVRLEE